MKEINKSSEKIFGFFFSSIFLILSLYLSYYYENNTYLFFLFVSILLVILSLFFPNSLKPLNSLWFKLGILLGSIISPIVMFLIFFLIVYPIGLFMKIFGKEVLKLKIDKNSNSYWEKRSNVNQSMKNQF